MRVIQIEPAEAPRSLDPHAGVHPLSAADYAAHKPDAHFDITSGHAVSARCSVWWDGVRSLHGRRVGFVGHYAASDAQSGRRVLRLACERLAKAGCTRAIGPIDGSTWRRYRFVTDRVLSATGHPRQPGFFLEPDNPDAWPQHFEAEGFRSLTTYRSARTVGLDFPDRARTVDERGRRAGISIRPLDPGKLDDELRLLHDISIASFADNFLYAPIAASEFERQYRAALLQVRPELVSIAESHGDPVAFVFAVPDVLEGSRTPGGSISTIVVKTLAVLPRWRGQGLGTLLYDRTNAVASALGYTRAIHALMHDGNLSQRISGEAETIRVYSLYARTL